MDSKPKIPQQQVQSQSVELPRSEASLNSPTNPADKKSAQKKNSSVPRFGLPEDYPHDDLFL